MDDLNSSASELEDNSDVGSVFLKRVFYVNTDNYFSYLSRQFKYI